jgi:hypothetical protein
MWATPRVYRQKGKQGNDQVQGKSGGIMLLIINTLYKIICTLNLRERTRIVRKRLDWKVKADILAVGSEEC